MTHEALKKMYQLLLTEPHAPTVCAQLECIAREALADHAMRNVQRLGQEIEQEKALHALHDENKRLGLYEDAYAEPGQEPVALHCCAYTDASAVKWNPFNGVVQCHNCGQTYTSPQRTEPVIDKSAAIRIATALGWEPKRT